MKRDTIIGLAVLLIVAGLVYGCVKNVYQGRLDNYPMEELLSADLTRMLKYKIQSRGGDPNGVDDDGIPLLCLAVSNRRSSEVVKILLESGASVDVTCQNGQSPYLLAAAGEEVACLMLLIQFGGVPSQEIVISMIDAARDQGIIEYLETIRE